MRSAASLPVSFASAASIRPEDYASYPVTAAEKRRAAEVTVRLPASTEYVKPHEDAYFYPKSFPHIFPYGYGGPTDDIRAIPIPTHVYHRHMMTESSGRAQHCFPLMAAWYRARMMKSSNAAAYIATASSSDSTFKQTPPSAGQLRAAARFLNLNPDAPRLEHEQEMMEIVAKLMSYGGNLKTTAFHIRKHRAQLQAMLASPDMSRPVWFLTLSSSDLHWPELFVAISNGVLVGEIFSVTQYHIDWIE